MEKILICIPTYNEAENIIPLLEKIRATNKLVDQFSIEPVIIDDNSPDGTANLVNTFRNNNKEFRVHLVNNPKKGGLGKAYITGFKYCIKKKAYAIQMMDADFSHDPEYLPTILSKLNNYDIVIGSRYIDGGGSENWNRIRKFISKGGNIYSKTILGIDIYDLTGGFNCFKREVIESLNLNQIKSNGYSFQIELKYLAKKKEFSHCETPIIFKDRKHGDSKFDSSIFREAIFTPWKLRFSNK